MSEATTTPKVTRTRSVLHFNREASQLTEPGYPKAVFTNEEDVRPKVELSLEQWADLGSPTELTIAIWPGDRQDLFDDTAQWESFPA